MGNFLTSWEPVSFSWRTLLHAVRVSVHLWIFIQCNKPTNPHQHNMFCHILLFTWMWSRASKDWTVQISWTTQPIFTKIETDKRPMDDIRFGTMSLTSRKLGNKTDVDILPLDGVETRRNWGIDRFHETWYGYDAIRGHPKLPHF
jgi:hypothetical protein